MELKVASKLRENSALHYFFFWKKLRNCTFHGCAKQPKPSANPYPATDQGIEGTLKQNTMQYHTNKLLRTVLVISPL